MSKRRPRGRPAQAQPQAHALSRSTVTPALLTFAVLFIGMQLYTSHLQSATWDEPGHLLAGYAAAARGDYRIDIEHPPLLRLWASAPLLFTRVNADALSGVDAMQPDAVAFEGPFLRGHQFMYRDNDGDRLLRRARVMIMVLGVALGIVVFCWTAEWMGDGAGLVALALYLFEPNLAAHAGLATTDLGVTFFIFASMYFLWRASRGRPRLNLAIAGASCVAAMLSKLSAVALLPMVVGVASALVLRQRLRAKDAIGFLLLLAVLSFAAVWAAYGLSWAPSRTPGWTFALHHAQGLATGRPAFLMGAYSFYGWWYYFPIAFGLKTQLAVLVLFAIGVWIAARRDGVFALQGNAFVFVPVLGFFALAMASALNIGIRHVLPVYPLVIVVAAAGANWLIARANPRRRTIVAGAIVAFSAAEFAWAYPSPLSFFNALAGGPRNGYRYLADSNVDWDRRNSPDTSP